MNNINDSNSKKCTINNSQCATTMDEGSAEGHVSQIDLHNLGE